MTSVENASSLRGRRFLLISPSFFGYHTHVKAELESRGAEVLFFDDRASNSTFFKAAVRLELEIFYRRLNSDYESRIFEALNGFVPTDIFLLNPEAISAKFVSELRCCFPGLRITTYFWDSFSNRRRAKDFIALSDKFCSFDYQDCVDNERVEFQPLFYVEQTFADNLSSAARVIEVCFIGTLHSDRHRVLARVVDEIRKQFSEDITVFLYFYCPSRFMFLIRTVLGVFWRGFGDASVSFKPLSYEATVSVFQRSKIVIDIHEPDQRGLTMRTFEALAAGAVLVTTNPGVVHLGSDILRKAIVVNRKAPQVDRSELIKCLAQEMPAELGDYSLQKWVDRLIEVDR